MTEAAVVSYNVVWHMLSYLFTLFKGIPGKTLHILQVFTALVGIYMYAIIIQYTE